MLRNKSGPHFDISEDISFLSFSAFEETWGVFEWSINSWMKKEFKENENRTTLVIWVARFLLSYHLYFKGYVNILMDQK